MPRLQETATAQQRTEIVTSAQRRGQAGRPPIERLAPGSYLIVDSDEDMRVHEIAEGVTRIGRAMAADMRLDDHTVSVRHAIVATTDTGVRLLDDRSTNGTFVNGERTISHDLSSGDAIVLGRVTLSYLVVT